MIPEEILNDKQILDMYEKIDKSEIREFGGSHGKKHAFNVMKFCENILRELKCSEEDIKLGKIAGLLHDIGCIDGKTDHEVNSAAYAKKYLSKTDLTEKQIDTVIDAIANHRNGEQLNSKISAALCFSDKIDITKERVINKNALENDKFHKNLLNINSVKLSFAEDEISVNYNVNEKFIPEDLFDWDKAITIPKKIANYLDKEIKFKINGIDSKEYNEYTKK